MVSRPGWVTARRSWGAPLDTGRAWRCGLCHGRSRSGRAGSDGARAGTADWNPLGELVQPGDRVVLKPNFVSNKNFHQRLSGEHLACLVHTGGGAAAADRLCAAGGWAAGACRSSMPRSRAANVDEVLRALGVQDHATRPYRAAGHAVEFLDLRDFCIKAAHAARQRAGGGARPLNLGSGCGSPCRRSRHYAVVDLGARLSFADVPERSCAPGLFIAPIRIRRCRIIVGRHLLPKTAGCRRGSSPSPSFGRRTRSRRDLSLKSAIGLCNQKYWLPTTRWAPPPKGRRVPLPAALSVRLRNQLQRSRRCRRRLTITFAGGAGSVVAQPQNGMPRWLTSSRARGEGNDTIWRTTLDLCHLLHFVDREGRLRDTPQRRHLALVDGILGGEGKGRWQPPQAGWAAGRWRGSGAGRFRRDRGDGL